MIENERRQRRRSKGRICRGNEGWRRRVEEIRRDKGEIMEGKVGKIKKGEVGEVGEAW